MIRGKQKVFKRKLNWVLNLCIVTESFYGLEPFGKSEQKKEKRKIDE